MLEQKRSEQHIEPNQLTHEVRVSMIAEDVVKGMQKADLLDKYMKLWELSAVAVNCLIRGAYSYLYNKSNVTVEQIKQLNLERLEAILEQPNTSVRDQLKAIDLSNKTMGVYEQQIKVKTDDAIRFDIGITNESNQE